MASFWKNLRWLSLSVLSGLLSGAAAALFLFLLKWATSTRNAQPMIIWALPLAGLFIGWAYYRHGKSVAGGNNLILDEIHDPKKVLSFRMAPFVLVGTVLTHLFGGSAGREGTAVQMGASLSDQINRFLVLEPSERKILLAAGAGAGFGAAIGAPWAGTIFGMEVIHVGKFRLVGWLECLIASFVGFYTTKLLGAPHTHYPLFPIPPYALSALLFVGLSGLLFGFVARVFIWTTHRIEAFHRRYLPYSPLRPFLAGIFLVVLYWLEGSYRYVGLGLPYIQEAIVHQASFADPVKKLFFTALTVGSGFKGGEFIPLVFIGTTLGSALGLIAPALFSLLAATGFAAVFAGAANTPIACSLMAMEIFGYRIAPYAFLACFCSYYVSGHKGIYASQRHHGKKHDKLLWVPRKLSVWLAGPGRGSRRG
jgi:H+/Cl- antiporter ClcA